MTSPAERIAMWLVGPARLSGDPVAVASGLVARLTRAGVPVDRLRISMRVVNPLLSAWGVVWTPEGGAELHTVERAFVETGAFIGSPIQHVVETRTSVRQRLDRLGPADHRLLHELADEGFRDYLAIPVEFGDGVV
jgi:adenylate cyclase